VVGVEAGTLDSVGELPGRRSPAPDPLEQAHEKEIEESLMAAVDQLSAKHRQVFVLHACEGLSYKEIAEVVGCNIGTVMSRLFYARKKVQEILQAQGYDVARWRSVRSERSTTKKNR
jgi:RNA polymerase sigma factor (sigma-70 family)